MTFTSHIFLKTQRLSRWLAGVMVGCALLMAAVFLRDDRRGGNTGLPEAGVAPVAMSVWREAPAHLAPAYSVMQGGAEDTGDAAHAFLAAFRFAGTFSLYETGGENPSLRRGVLSYLPENRQEIVSEGTLIGGVRVKHLFEDRIVLEKDGKEGVLFLGGGAEGMARSYLAGTPASDGLAPVRTRFGEQTENGVWTMDKSALMAYYEELLEAPERMLQVFDSLHPLYSPDGAAIEGYVLQNEGEREFFEAVGFQEGDVVRKVNTLPMTNRGRAEFFLRQVVEDRLSAVVIDVERGGETKRLVYQLR